MGTGHFRTLSDNELTALALLAKGYRTRELGAVLGVTDAYVYFLVRMLRMRFDVKTNAALISQAIAEGVLPVQGGPGQGGGMKILCVEDDAANRDIIDSLARLEGDMLLAAATAHQALVLLAENPDLILVDVGLPDMNGLVLIRQMRDRLPQVPIIALTANALLDDEERCRAAGCTGYLPKPFDFEALRAYLRQYRHPPAPSQPDMRPA